MNEQMMKERIQQALNAQMSGVRTSPAERSRMLENAIGGTKVKRKPSFPISPLRIFAA